MTQQVTNAGSPDTDASTETAVASFGCGEMTCDVDEHACCPVGDSFGCFPLAQGCPTEAPADGGVTPPPTSGLKCTTYRNCKGGEQCCFDAPIGAAACLKAPSCPPNQLRLCTTGTDTCKKDEACTGLPSPPLPNVGECVRTGPPKP